MRYLLNLIYIALLAIVSPLVLYSAMIRGKYRQGFAAKFLGWVPARKSDRPCVWLHGVSVGEVNVLVHLVPQLERQHPDHEFVISTTTRTGYQLALGRFPDKTVFYCPLDFSWAVSAALRRLRPSLLVLVELELWPNLVFAARRAGARIVVVNGRLSQTSWRGYRRVRLLMRRVLARVDQIAAQNEEYAWRFRDLGAARCDVVVTGSMKFDGAETDRNNERTQSLQCLLQVKEDQTVFLAGSTQAPEEKLCLSVFQQLYKQHPCLRFVVVPRHPERFDEVAALLSRSGIRWCRRSEMQGDNDVLIRDSSVILVDTIGELSAWWGLAEIGFVGGSLGSRGGQNMIEPAAYGVATCFGPNTRNFRDVVEALCKSDAARVVRDETELRDFVARCLEDVTFRRSLAERARRLVAGQRGATTMTCDMIRKRLSKLEFAEDRIDARLARSETQLRKAS